MLTEFLTRLRFLVTRKAPEEVDEELRSHLEHLIEMNIAAGMPPDQARRNAAIAFGGVEQTLEACREQAPGWFKIGRASCRERGVDLGGRRIIKKKKKRRQ